MNPARRDKPTSRRRFLSYATVGLGAIISAVVRRPVQICLVSTVVIVIGVAGFLMMLQTLTVNAAPEPAPPLDCMSCHTKNLEFHDKLGSGNKACWVCHDNTNMKMLRLVDETQLPLSGSPQICAQCHQKRYDAWSEGTHGIPAWKEGVPAMSGADKAKCTDCHNPHQPQIALLNITKSHPPPAPSPPSPSTELLIILGISLVLVIGICIAVAMKGERT